MYETDKNLYWDKSLILQHRLLLQHKLCAIITYTVIVVLNWDIIIEEKVKYIAFVRANIYGISHLEMMNKKMYQNRWLNILVMLLKNI